jgi:ribosomal-protein-alanine N-acetyltransferase
MKTRKKGEILMSVNFETERLSLRTQRLEDIVKVMGFWGDEEVMKYCGGANSKENLEKAISFYIDQQNKKGFSPYIVTIKETGEIIGVCGYNPTKNDDEIELIYHFIKEYWGKGYATEAAMACIKYASENCKNINKITASVDPRHNASIKTLEKVGFKYTHTEYCDITKQNEPYYEIILQS